MAGVSAHWLEEEYDTGAVIASRTLDVDPSWNAWTLAKALDRPSLALLRRVVRDLAALGPGEKLPSIAQDAAHATSAPTPSDADLEIDWNCTCAQIARRVRAAAPYPGVFTELAGQEFVLVSVASLPLSRELAALVPGEMVVHGERPVVRASDGGIEIRKASVGDGPILEGSTLVDLCRRAL